MRTLTTGFRNSLEKPYSDEIPLIFATITHPNLADVIRLANDVVDYLWTPPSPSVGQYTYVGFPFDITILSDSDRAPSATIRLQNVDGKIGTAALQLISSPRLTLQILAASDFGDVTAYVKADGSPGKKRTEIAPTVQYQAPHLRLRNVKGDVMAIEAELWSYDLSQEPYPAIRTTKDNVPGLWR